MTFAQKQAIVMLLFLSIILSLGGAWTIQQNFKHSCAEAENKNMILHRRECYQLEAALEQAEAIDSEDISEAAQRYAEEQSAVFGDAQSFFTVFNCVFNKYAIK